MGITVGASVAKELVAKVLSAHCGRTEHDYFLFRLVAPQGKVLGPWFDLLPRALCLLDEKRLWPIHLQDGNRSIGRSICLCLLLVCVFVHMNQVSERSAPVVLTSTTVAASNWSLLVGDEGRHPLEQMRTHGRLDVENEAMVPGSESWLAAQLD